MRDLVRDFRYALRGMRRNPLFVTVAVLSLALGIGANTAIFTLMDQLMLRQLPIDNPGELVMLYQRGAHNGSNMGSRMHSYPIYQDYQEKAEPFADVLCRRTMMSSVTVGNDTERINAEMVSGNYFSLLGVEPAAGRLFTQEEDEVAENAHPVVVLNYDYWVERFEGNRDIVGQKILVNNYPMDVVGIAAPGFDGLDPVGAPQLWVPILMKPTMAPDWSWFEYDARRSRWVQVFARLKPGYTVETAQPAMDVLFRQIREYEATLEAANSWSDFSRQRFLEGTIHVEAAGTGYSDLRNSFSTALIVLMGMVGLVLLIACANVANLLIARAFARRKEIAVRLSIGATRLRLVRQLLAESLTLSILGGAAGIAVAFLLTRTLLSMIPIEGNPLLISPLPDLRILLFTLALTVTTGIVFGLAPALRASRPDLFPTLKDAVGSIAGGGGSLFLRKSLVASQIALCFLLLFGAGLFVRSLNNLQTTESGFDDIDNLVTFQISPELSGYETERVTSFYNQLLERLNATPGISSAAFASVPLLHGWEWDSSTQVEGHEAEDGEDMQAYMNSLSPGYFETMGIPLLAGRDFDRADIKEDSKIAIVNRNFAEHFFGDRPAVGRRLGRGRREDPLDIEIVGVVEDSLYEGPREGIRRQVFIPNYGNRGVAFYARTTLGSSDAYNAIRAEVQRLDASLPIYEMKTLGKQLDETLLTERLVALLSAGFGLLATLLAAIGLYGVIAFSVARRTKELGLRMALGAQSSSVIWLVMKEVLMLLAIGLAIGIPAALVSARYVSSQLYGVEGTDVITVTAAIGLLLLVSATAGLIPAQRASRIDPMQALRME